jgi:hypothetical protein
MCRFYDNWRARISDRRRRLENLKSAPSLYPIGGSIDAAAAAVRELRRQIGVYETLLDQPPCGPART